MKAPGGPSFAAVLSLVCAMAGWVSAGSWLHGDAAMAQTRAEGVYHLVAVMVEFQPDDNRLTTGDGTFGPGSIPYLEDPGTRVDPLPHDRRYFQAHLEFVKRYFETQSFGRVEIVPIVLPEVVRLPERMEAYSPLGEDPGAEPLARMASDAWAQVAMSGPNRKALLDAAEGGSLGAGAGGSWGAGSESSFGPLDPSRTGFILFHAGIGRDLELTGTTLDKTPQDIPSVYMDQESLSRLLEDPGFDGFEIVDGDRVMRVRNTMIVPRTQSRSGSDITGAPFVLPLSVNGMLAAQVGSFLGLPDLFDTKTGASGIGRFGLMDGAGIFAMNGLFPPSLSAWEKRRLGWVDPLVVDPARLPADGSAALSLSAPTAARQGTMVEIPVTGSEYFLLENRHRDPEGAGVELTFAMADGSTESVRFTNLDTGFLSLGLGFDTLLPAGVLIDVSHYDFALPGGADTGGENRDPLPTDRQLNGGILIWHVDETVISAADADPERGINDDPARRGVDLEEADGAQDIGFATSLGFSSIDPSGSAFDFWWDGNDARVITSTREITLYANRFDDASTPSNRSVGGAAAGFSLTDFTANLPVAGVTLRPVSTSGEAGSSSQALIGSGRLDDQFGARLNGDPTQPEGARSIPTMLREEDGGRWLVAAGAGRVWALAIEGVANRAEGSAPGGASGQGGADADVVIFAEGAFDSPLIYGNRVILRERAGTGGSGGSGGSGAHDRVSAFAWNRSAGAFTELWNAEVPAGTGPLRIVDGFLLAAELDRWAIDPSTGEFLRVNRAAGLTTPSLLDVRAEWNASGIVIRHKAVETRIQLPLAPEQGTRRQIGLVEAAPGDIAVWILNGDELSVSMPPYASLRPLPSPAGPFLPTFGDLDLDGRMDVLMVSADSTRLTAMTLEGAVLDHFPVSAPSGSRFSEGPLLADVSSQPFGLEATAEGAWDPEADPFPEILIPMERDGMHTLAAIHASGLLLDHPRVAIGGERAAADGGMTAEGLLQTPLLSLFGDTLVTVGPDGDVRLHRLRPHRNTQWSTRWGSTPMEGWTAPLEGGVRLGEPDEVLLARDGTYNWPNPAGESTHIRFETSAPSTVRIRIISQSGRVRYDSTVASEGRGPTDVLIDTSGWASGLYIVQVSASAGGRTERHLFNLGVAR